MTLDVPPPPGDSPPPPPGEPTPAASVPLTPIVLPAGAPTRSPVLLIVVGAAALLGLIVNSVGLVGFPGNAPIEMFYALGINVDLFAIAVASAVGAIVSRRGYPLRPTTPITTIAVAFAAASAVIWMLAGGLSSVIGLAFGSGRYMYASGGLFFSGAFWVLAVVFGSHGYRRGGTTTNNVIAFVALGVAGLLALYAIFSSVIYGMGLTD